MKYLGGPGRWPGRARVLALGCCAGSRGGSSPGTFCRESLPCPAGLTHRGCSPAAGRSRPSQWREGAGTCARLSGEWVLCVAPTAAGEGRLNSASSLGDPSPFPLRWAFGGPRCPAWCAGPSPGPGFPRGTGAGPRPSPPRKRASGAGVRERTWGPWFGRLPAADTRATGVPVQPAVGGLSTADCSGWSSESAFLCRKPLKDSSSWKRGLPRRPVPRWRRRGRGASLRPSQVQRPVPVQPQVPKPRRCASTPPRLIELAPSGTSRDGRGDKRSAGQRESQWASCRVCSVRCRRVLSPTSPPQDGSGRRRALHMPNSVGSMCQTARGTKQWDLHALTGRPAGGGVGLARSVESM